MQNWWSREEVVLYSTLSYMTLILTSEQSTALTCSSWQTLYGETTLSMYIIATLELSFYSSRLLVGSWLSCLQNLPCLVRLCCMCEGSAEAWTKSILYRFMEGQNEFDPSWNDIECSLFKPPHYLHTCTKNLSNMESYVSKTTNSLPKVTMS
jgi:hypothetical protein